MKKRYAMLCSFSLIVLLLLAACGGSPSANESNEPGAQDQAALNSDSAMDDNHPAADESTSDESMSDESMSDESMSDESMSDESMSDEATDGETSADVASDEDVMAGGERPAWQQLALTDVRTGESFTFADFAGKTVFVEPMATWCGNCRQQLGNVQQAQAQLADEDVVFVALSVETNLSDAQLAEYSQANGFDWRFAVLTPEALQALAAEFGRTISNPPATPHFVIRPDGSTTDLVTGIESAEQLISQITAAQG